MTSFNTNAAAQPTWGKNILRSVSKTFNRMVKRAQVAKMISALNDMTDRNLADIGVSRSEIAQHAERLVNGSDTKD